MKWLEFTLRVPAEAVEAVAALFHEVGEGGVAVEQSLAPLADQPEQVVLAPEPVRVRTYVPVDDAVAERQRRVEEGVWHLNQIVPVGALEVHEVAEEDWAESWKAHFQVQRLSRRVVVKPSWREHRAAAGEVLVELDPGMAFGTGLHPTTRMCVAALEEHLRPGSAVLDLGTGTGILAIVAAKLGAHTVLALDLDPTAVEAAEQNVARNGEAARVRVRRGTLGRADSSRGWWPLGSTGVPDLATIDVAAGSVDLLLANLLAQTLVDLAPELSHVLMPGGKLIGSGIVEPYLGEVEKALEMAGLHVDEVMAEQDWRTVIAARRT